MLKEYTAGYFNNSLIQFTQKYINNPNLRNAFIKSYQNIKLRGLVKHAFHNSRFFKSFYMEHGIKAKDISDLVITDLPIMTKQHILDHKDDIYTNKILTADFAEDLVFRPNTHTHLKNKFVGLKNSGSSGIPITITYSQSDWKKNLSYLFLTSKANKPKHEKKIKVAAIITVQKETERRSVPCAVMDSIHSSKFEIRKISILSPIEEIKAQLNEFQPHYVFGLSSVIKALTAYQKEGKLKISPCYIGAGGEELSEIDQTDIAQTFNAHVMNNYGSAECMFIGSKMHDENYFQLFPQCSLIEVLSTEDRHVNPGEEGSVIATNFLNYTQPFIRYRISDKVVYDLNDKQNPCIRTIRSREYKPINFITNTGKEISFHPHIFYGILAMLPGISRAQIILKNNEISANIVSTSEGFEHAKLVSGKFLFEKQLHESVNCKINKVESIQPDPSGKIPLIKYAV